MSTPAIYNPTEAEIQDYMAQHQVSHAVAEWKLIEAHLEAEKNTSH